MLIRMFLLLVSLSCFANYDPCFKIFSGSGNRDLANDVASCLGTSISPAIVEKYSDGEIKVQLLENIRNCHVFVIQSTSSSANSSVNDNLMELFLMIRTMKRSSAKSVTAVIPYYGYARQDRKMTARVPISASDVALLLEHAGADHIIAVDLHCGQIQGFFHKAPVDNLFASTIFVPYVAGLGLHDLVVIAPDAGGVERAKIFMEGLQKFGVPARMAMIVKQRACAGVIESMNLVGDISGSDVVIIDDICDTAGTLVHAAKELKNHGARRVFACITHPVLSGPACERIANSCIEELIVTDTIPFKTSVPPNITQLPISELLAEAILRTSNGESLSSLFK